MLRPSSHKICCISCVNTALAIKLFKKRLSFSFGGMIGSGLDVLYVLPAGDTS